MLSPIITVFQYYPLKTLVNFTMIFAAGYLSYNWLHRDYCSGIITKRYGIAKWLQIMYITVLFFFTVFGRRSWDYYRYDLEVGGTLREFLENGDMSALQSMVLNIGIFIPLGMLTVCTAKRWRFIKSVFLGMVITACIEVLQFIMKTGYFEFDDMINNIIGTGIGGFIIVVCYVLRWIIDGIKEYF